MARLPIGAHSAAVIAELMIPELVRVGIVDESGRRGFLEHVYRVYWWFVVLGVLLVPNDAVQATFYFPAVLGLCAAWLFAMPVYAQGLVSSAAEFSALRASPNLLRDFIDRLRVRPVQLPAVFEDEAQVTEAGSTLAADLPALIPSAMLVMVAKLATRVVATGIVAMVGLIGGAWLSTLHITWLRGWSPIAILCALSAPAVPILLGSLLVPILGYTYLISRKAEGPGQPSTEQD